MVPRSGARGYGSWREVCRRVVLDANMVNYAPMAEIDALRDRGFILSVSLEGLREVWSRSLKEQSYGQLASRIRNLSTRLDSDDPIAFAGNSLLASIGACSAEATKSGHRFRQNVNAGWRAICAAGLSKLDWERIGKELSEEVNRDEAWWLGQLCDIRALESRVKRNEAESVPYDRRRGWAIIRNGIARGAETSTVPPFERRMDAHLGYMIHKLKRALAGEQARNDYHDSRHLQHIAWPAFLATVDYGLIAAVDQVSLQQRAWVRTPVELVQDPIARCAPWGKPGAAVAASFARGPMKVLSLRQQRWREDLAARGGPKRPA